MRSRNPLKFWSILAPAAVMCCAHAVSAQQTYTVQLGGASFDYQGQSNLNIDLTINVGDTVRWDWVNGLHDVINGTFLPGDGDLFRSDTTDDPTYFFEYTFNTAGEYAYYCSVHRIFGMESSVTVIPAPAAVPLLVIGGCFLTRRRR